VSGLITNEALYLGALCRDHFRKSFCPVHYARGEFFVRFPTVVVYHYATEAGVMWRPRENGNY